MEKVWQGLHWHNLLLYLDDDITVVTKDFEEHIFRLGEVLQRLRKARLKLKLSKCEVLKEQVGYLGHIVSPDGVTTDPERWQQ